jgi:hypothetical protein
MVTLAIVSLLLAGAFGVVGAMARSQSIIKRSAGQVVPEARLRDLLAEDLCHADRYKILSAGLELRMHSMIDPATLNRRHITATVAYQVASVGNTSWLVRTQKAAGQPDLAELVCPYFGAITLDSTLDAGKPDADDTFVMPVFGTVTITRALPATGVVAIHFDSGASS